MEYSEGNISTIYLRDRIAVLYVQNNSEKVTQTCRHIRKIIM